MTFREAYDAMVAAARRLVDDGDDQTGPDPSGPEER